MSSWRECKLGECIEVINGYAFKSQNFLEEQIENSLPVIKIKNVANGDVNLKAVQFHLFDKSLEKYLIQKNDVLIALTGNHPQAITQVVGEASKYKLNELAFLNQRVAKIKARDNMSNDFLYYFLKDDASHDYLASQSSGSANQANISKSDIENMPISLPPLEEQKAIAEVLSSLDDKIDLLHHQNHTLESLAQTLFRQWFIEEAKEEWEEKPLGKITNITIGRTPPRKEEEWFSTDPQDVKWISIKDLGNDGAFIFKTSEYLTQEAVERFNVPVIPKDTVVLSFKMTVGRVAVTTEAMLSNEAIAHFKFNDKTPISKEYLYLFLKTFPYESLGSTSSIVTAINSAMIKEMMILIPDEKTIKDFSSIAEPQFEKIRQNQKQIQTLENLRDTLLPKFLSGEVRVKFDN
ncbi:restriction endonuclease subunit S [Arcobacter defluvii]|uniref:Type I restriction/modification system, specificity subunit n=1 Tax=Arcobacter defluvii TaxID=873191 RepID=A0AAE7BG32_9BACT|nr:restriction endonuclease subunit S [Arcobacter defluvii]QKF77109.1 type I restriction/modification system, specificity subunit [Arcobacter defluvii]RXI33598.1 type I restriction endonuclease subunit S [Arcobacter defluvii]